VPSQGTIVLAAVSLLAFPAGIAVATAPAKHRTKRRPATTARTTTAARAAAAADPPLPAPDDTWWLSFGHDDQLTKEVVSGAITPATVAHLHVLWRVPLAGSLVAQPLYDDGVVYAASEGGDVVAVDARTGQQLWRQQTPVVKTSACGSWGISSTPAIDRFRNRIYVAGANGRIYAYDLTTGGLQPGFPIRVVRSPAMEYVWGALRLLGTDVLVGVASHCDEPNAQGAFATGRLAAYDVVDDPGAQTAVFQPVPGPGHLGGIWGYGGVAISPDGSSLYTGVGNATGTDPACQCEHDDWGYGDSLVQLSASSLAVQGSNDPGIPTHDDDDWGAAPALFDPPGCPPLAVASNKDGLVYVYKQGALNAGPIWALGIGDGTSPLLDGPAWSPFTRMFYVAGARMPFDRSKPRTGEGIVAIKVGPGCTFSVAWTAQTGDGPQAPPIVVGDVVFASGGSGGVVALDAETGKELWSAQTSGPTYAPPSEAAGMLFAPDGSALVAWGP